MADFKDLIRIIQQQVNDFTSSIPGIQKRMLEALQSEIAKLDTKGDNVKISAANLKCLAGIRGRLQSIILNPEYVEAVRQYSTAFDQITKLQNAYFSEVSVKFTPPKLGKEIMKQAREAVVTSLTEKGIAANIETPLTEIFRKGVTGGSSIASLTKQITDASIDNEAGDGLLKKYAGQMATDALNQYSGQYTQIISSDLDFEWFRYAGANIETSRPFCLACTKKRWIHISEIPALLAGKFPEFEEFNGVMYKGLPAGMIPGTDVSNFMTNRGGYNCGHQLRPVSEDLVPQEVRDAVYATEAYKFWAKAMGKKPQKPSAPVAEEPAAAADKPASAEQQRRKDILEKNADVIDKFKAAKITMHEDLLEHLGDDITFEKSDKKDAAFYQPSSKKVVIGNLGDRINIQYFRDTLMAHEVGHAIHNTKGIISQGKVSPEFQEHFTGLKKLISGKQRSIHNAFWEKYKTVSGDEKEQLMVIYDILGSLTKGVFGGGHAKSYYKQAGKSEAEIFAHSVSLIKAKNNFEELTPEIKKVIDKMKEYISKVL